MKAIASIITAVTFLASTPFAIAGPYKSAIIKNNDPTFILEIPAKKAFIITTFSQDVAGGGGFHTLTVTINGKNADVLKSAFVADGQVPSTKDLVIAGPATITIVPGNGADLYLSYKIVAN